MTDKPFDPRSLDKLSSEMRKRFDNTERTYTYLGYVAALCDALEAIRQHPKSTAISMDVFRLMLEAKEETILEELKERSKRRIENLKVSP